MIIWTTLLTKVHTGLQDFMIQVLTQVLSLVVSIATIVYAVPYFMVLAIIIAYAHLWFSNGYVTASRDLRRIESNTLSPIISSFSELLTGIVTGKQRFYLTLILLTQRFSSSRVWSRKDTPTQDV